MNPVKAPVRSIRLCLYGTLLATLVIFSGWCVIDYIAVKQPDYPARVHDNDWAILLLPLLAFLTCYFCGRGLRVASSFWIAMGATAIAVLLSIPIIALFGVWFHFSIGGRL
jgi:hypothetical protein